MSRKYSCKWQTDLKQANNVPSAVFPYDTDVIDSNHVSVLNLPLSTHSTFTKANVIQSLNYFVFHYILLADVIIQRDLQCTFKKKSDLCSIGPTAISKDKRKQHLAHLLANQ